MSPGQRSAAALAFTLCGGVVFMASLLYFVYCYLVPFGAATGTPMGAAAALAIDVALFSVFALHHSLFARFGLKAIITRGAPRLERSLYVWVASLLLIGICAWWEPIAGVAWQVPADSPLRYVLLAVQLAGGVAAVQSARQLDVFALAGIRQVLTDVSAANHPLARHGSYGFVRHPIYFWWVLFVWPSPEMTNTRLAFAAISTIYLALAVPFEERDLTRIYGAEYDDYKRQVRWKIIPGIY